MVIDMLIRGIEESRGHLLDFWFNKHIGIPAKLVEFDVPLDVPQFR